MWKISLIITISKHICDNFSVIPVSIFVASFNLLSSGLDNFTFALLYWAILLWQYIKAKQVYETRS